MVAAGHADRAAWMAIGIESFSPLLMGMLAEHRERQQSPATGAVFDRDGLFNRCF